MSRAPTGRLDPFVLGDRLGDPVGERDAAALDPDERQTGRAGLLLDDLVGDPDRRPADLVRRHDLAPGHPGPAVGSLHARSFPASRTGP